MFRIIYLLVLICGFTDLLAQSFQGSWTGTLKVGIQELKLQIHVDSTGPHQVIANFDSPNQGAFGVPFSDVRIRNGVLLCRISEADITFQAELIAEDDMEGRWIQGGQSFPISLKPMLESEAKPIRPQEPKPPFPYREETFVFLSDQGDTLRGTLTIPNGRKRFPAVVLITGSGPQDRNSEILGHKPFLVLADYLTRSGIAVLRYDERGVGESGGSFETATTEDFGKDAASAYRSLIKLKRVDKKRVGFFGHSEGGWSALIANNELGSSPPAFLIMAAASGLPAKDLLLLQRDRIETVQGLSKRQREKSRQDVEVYFDLFLEANSLEEAQQKIEGHFAKLAQSSTDAEALRKQHDLVARSMLTPWFYFFMRYDVNEGIRNISSPTLVINGKLDTQVPAEENTRTFRRILQQNRIPVEVKLYDNLNHLFQTCTDGDPLKYASNEETFSEVVMQDIAEFILNRK
jgi:fermentation-respiration switch protein FrsA (DUF1100 family)